ncbi:MAG: TetR/AcrR family transcriptional regulator [Chloroflexi bacterium]|nr:TetR/AcrR family transcriptional regulator [Chloroflexota bacterium]
MSKNSEARERVLAAAEKLFSERGYISVSLRDIAEEIGIKHTSLYHHAPDGKEALYVEVSERLFERHQKAMNEAMLQHPEDLRAQLRAIADWLLSQPPVDSIQVVNIEMPLLERANAERLSDAAEAALLTPLRSALIAAHKRSEIGQHDFLMVAGGLIGMIESLHAVPTFGVEKAREQMAYELIDIFLEGLLVNR